MKSTVLFLFPAAIFSVASAYADNSVRPKLGLFSGAMSTGSVTRPLLAAGSSASAGGRNQALAAVLVRHRATVLAGKASGAGNVYFHLDSHTIRNAAAAQLSPAPITDPRVRQIFVQVNLSQAPIIVRGNYGAVGTVTDTASRPSGRPLTVISQIDGVNLKVINPK